MLINIADPDQDSLSVPSEQEDRILSEISTINRQLRAKMDSRTDIAQSIEWGRRKEDDLFTQNRGIQMKDKASLPIYSANMEYFS